MQVVDATKRLFLSASGELFDDGGIEMIDLNTLESLGLIVPEKGKSVGADVGAFVLIASDRGYLSFSTDLALSSHLVEFTVAGGVIPSGALFETVGYFVPTLPYALSAGTLFFPDGGIHPSAVHVLDADSVEQVASITVGPSTTPTDVLVLPPVSAGPMIPAASSWGSLILGLAVMTAGSLVLGAPRSAPTATTTAAPDGRSGRV